MQRVPGIARSTSHLPLLGAVILLAAVLRLLFLGAESLWLDEAFSVSLARARWDWFLKVLFNKEANMALYHVLLRFWLSLGESEFFVRSLSVLPAVLTVPVLYALGVRLFDTRVGLLAALLIALNEFHIEYAQEARSYSLTVLLVTLSSLFFVRSIERPSRKDWAAYVLTSALAVYSHFFGALVLAAHWASVLFLKRRNVPWKGLVASTALIGLLLLPLGVFTLTGVQTQISWIRPPEVADVGKLFLTMAGGPLLLIVYSVPCLLALTVAARRSRPAGAPREIWRHGLLVIWLFLPVTLALGVSAVKPLFVERYLIVCLPPFLILAALGLSRLKSRLILAGALIAIVGLAAPQLFAYYRPFHKDDWRGATQYVLSQAKSADAVLFFPDFIRRPFDYYRDRLQGSREGPSVVFPSVESSRFEAPSMPTPSDILLERLPVHYDRVWLVLKGHQPASGDTISRSIQESLGSHFALVRGRTFTENRIIVQLYSKIPVTR
ncbi:MAG: glycosyltransferase family 39 protein [Acidimicrobiia bacterium]